MNLSPHAKILLATACEYSVKQIINNSKNVDNNKYIAINGKQMNYEGYESYSLWLVALEELEQKGFVKQANEMVYNVTHEGLMENKNQASN